MAWGLPDTLTGLSNVPLPLSGNEVLPIVKGMNTYKIAVTDLPSSGGGGSPSSFAGALVKKSANQIGADFSTATAITWDAESYDTDNIHSTATNTSRLTVPAGWSKARLWGHVGLNNVSGGSWQRLNILKNGVTYYDGYAALLTSVPETGGRNLIVQTPAINVIPGDYFELFLNSSDLSVDIVAAVSSFAIERVA